ncbi:MAG: hypothetical protein QOC59_1097 [Microbacteriaceae bacterium]|nr:hypothetical protein [Microbacteriaceae bacterium]
MTAIGNVRWTLVEVDEGRAYDVRSVQRDGTAGDLSFGRVRFSEHGWVAHGTDAEAYGPFTTVDEAAYPLALRGYGDDASLLLGPGTPEPGASAPLPLAPAPRRRIDPPPPQLVFWLIVGLLLVTVPMVLPPRDRARDRRAVARRRRV